MEDLEMEKKTQLERGLNIIQGILLCGLIATLVIGVPLELTKHLRGTAVVAASVPEKTIQESLDIQVPAQAITNEKDITSEDPILSDRDKRVADAEIGGTAVDSFMRVSSDKAVIYTEKNGAVLGELSKGDYVYVHILYEDGFVYSGQLQGYLKSEELVDLAEYIEEPVEFRSSLVEPSQVNNFEELETYHLSMPTVEINADCTYVINTQESTDTYDIVHAKGLSFVRLSGHNTRSLKKLHNVKVGDEFTYNDIDYVVTFSGTGVVTEDWENVMSDETGELLLCTSDIELITCYETWKNSMNRWVVLGKEK